MAFSVIFHTYYLTSACHIGGLNTFHSMGYRFDVILLMSNLLLMKLSYFYL